MRLEIDLKDVVLALFEANPDFSLQKISDELGIPIQKIIHDLGLQNHHHTVTMGKALPILNRLVGPTDNILRLTGLSKDRFLEEVAAIEKRSPKPQALSEQPA